MRLTGFSEIYVPFVTSTGSSNWKGVNLPRTGDAASASPINVISIHRVRIDAHRDDAATDDDRQLKFVGLRNDFRAVHAGSHCEGPRT